ncbi:MAG: sulfatase [Gammaproteobacteria bacterium]|nr:sulfatase [Gammaproteobacteria bacterium]
MKTTQSLGILLALGWIPNLAAIDRPNLLVITTDEHNFRTLGCYRDLMPEDQALIWGNDAIVTTPHIDWLAQQGAICTSFYATTPVCSPSRSSLVSGCYPQHTPVVTNNIPMNESVITFAEILRRQGYATGYAGKWHLDGSGKPQWAPERKFGFEDNRYMFNRGHWKQLEDTPRGPRVKARNAKGAATYDVKGADEKSFTTDFLTDKTIDFINTHTGGSFCYMVSIPDPHGPDTVRPPYDTLYQDQQSRPPKTFTVKAGSLPSWAQPSGGFSGMAKYFGMVKCIDDNVGRMLAALREKELLEKTIVVFTSDHGDLRGEHHRQNKGVPFEASAKIPFILYYADVVPAGTVIHEALGCVDFLPTILNLMDIPTAGREQGRDASALFRNGEAPAGWNDIVFVRSTGHERGWLAAITDRYKLVYSTADEPWLFDLQKDPDELVNQYDKPDYHGITRMLARQLADYGQRFADIRITNARIQAQITALGE